MRVLQLINTLSAGGAELHLLTLCRQLRRRGVEVVVACLREHVRGSRSLRPDFEREGIRVVGLGADARYDMRFLCAVMRLVREEAPEILHTHLPRADLAGAAAHAVRDSISWVCSIHDLYKKSWSGKWMLPVLCAAWRRADAVVAVSHVVRTWLVHEARIPRQHVDVIHYGIEPEHFNSPAMDLRARWNLDGHAVIGSIGRLEPRKGHETLVRAMPAILRNVPNARLLIAGHDPWGYGRRLQAEIRARGVAEQVQLIGFQADVPSFLHAIDIFAFATSSEGFGQVLLEAMAAGKAVAASNIAPLTEIVEHRETGLLVRSGDAEAFAHAISWLLLYPCEAQLMGTRGRTRVRSYFAADRMAEQTLALYHRVRASRSVMDPAREPNM